MRGREALNAFARSRRGVALVALCTAALASGCAATAPTPPDPSYLPYEETLPGYPYGGLATVQVVGDPSTTPPQGELVAADRDSLFLFLGETFTVIPGARLLRVRVIQYKGQNPAVESFGAGENIKDRAARLRRLSVYARFPQGLPPDLDRAALHARPPTAP
jgi:hypothetical protein